MDGIFEGLLEIKLQKDFPENFSEKFGFFKIFSGNSFKFFSGNSCQK